MSMMGITAQLLLLVALGLQASAQQDIVATPVITMVQPASPTSIMVVWTQQGEVDSFEIAYERVTGAMQQGPCPSVENSSTVTVTNGTARQQTVSGLEEFSTYSFTITAMAGSTSQPSESMTATTEQAAPSGPPESVRAVAVTSTSITVAWDPVTCIDRNSEITQYAVRYGPESMPDDRETVSVPGSGDTGGMYTITPLTPFTNYSIQVAAVNSGGQTGMFSDAIVVEPDDPSPVQNLRGIPHSISIDVSWSEPAMPNGITAYEVYYQQHRELGNITDTSMTSTVLTGLRPETTYTISVRARTIAGPGEEESINVTTGLAVPQIVRVLPLTCSTLLVLFKVRHSQISQYKIYGSYNGTNGSSLTITYDCSDMQGSVGYCTIGGLQPAMTVEVEVAGVNDTEEGPRSAPVTETTLEGFPSEVSGPLWERQSDTSVTVSWGEPTTPNGVILGYNVTLQRYEGGGIEVMEVNETVFEVEFSNNNLQDVILEAGVPYIVTVIAVNTAVENRMPCCENLRLREARTTNFTREKVPEVAPDITAVDRINDTHLMITWKPLSLVEARGFVTSYTISYQPSGSRLKRQAPVDHSVPQDQSSAVVGGLNPEVAYLVEVWASTTTRGPSTTQTVPAFDAPGDEQEQESTSAVVIVLGVLVGLLALVTAVVCFIAIVHITRLWKRGKLQISVMSQCKSQRNGVESKGAVELVAIRGAPKISEDTDVGFTSFSNSLRIPVEKFSDHVAYMHKDKRFQIEYESIGTDPQASYDASQMEANTLRNRFKNIFPYDFNRVKLQEVPGEEGSDYINASFLDGYRRLNAYIGGQGPTVRTIKDFWRMIWEYRLPTVVMLARCFETGKKKCQEYWPGSVDESITPGYNLSVTLTSVLPFAKYEIKKLLVRDTSKPEEPPLEVTHLHYVAWPDHGVPSDAMALINFIKLVRKRHPVTHDKPLLVHCSAGVGRTGTFIVLDSMMEMMMAEGTVDIYDFMKKLREQRVYMVQTESQYVFIHDALNELINCGETEIAVANLRITIHWLSKMEQGKWRFGFRRQFEFLNKVSAKDDVDCSQAMAPSSLPKNRYANKLPNDINRVRLRVLAGDSSDYINASFIDGYRQHGAYIATQGPLEDTVNDFWRMVWENQCKCIVMLCNLQEEGTESCHCYWPGEQGSSQVYGRLKVTFQSEEAHEDYIVRKLQISEDQPTPMVKEMTVKQFQYIEWPRRCIPASTSSLLELADSVTKAQMSSGNKAIVVMCNNGVGRTGTFISIHAQLERLKTEGLVDFFQFIKSARMHRAGLVQTVEQYVLCHDVLADFVDSFEEYANFKDKIMV